MVGKRLVRNRQRMARLQSDAMEVAGRRMLSLSGRSAAETQMLWATWGWEKVLTAQRAYWEVAGTLWKMALAPGSRMTSHALENVLHASLRPFHRQVRRNRNRLRN